MRYGPGGVKVEVGEAWSCQNVLRSHKKREEAEEEDAGEKDERGAQQAELEDTSVWGRLGVWHSGGSQGYNEDVESAEEIWSLAGQNTHDNHVYEDGDEGIHAEKCGKEGDGARTEENMREEEREGLDGEKKADGDLILPWQGGVKICEEMLLCHILG